MSSLQEIVSKYESLGTDDLKDTRKNMKYSDELKMCAAEDYLSGKGSLLEICRKYKIRSKAALGDWIKWYNGHSGSNKTKGQKPYDQRTENHTGRMNRDSGVLH